MRKQSLTAGLSTITILILAIAVLIAERVASGQAPPAQAISNSGPSAKLKEYEVVSIKENKSVDQSSSWMSTPDGFRIVNGTLKGEVADAYGVRVDLISGGPGWLASRKFDVEAKVAGADVEAYKKLDEKDRKAMLKALLRERLGLQAHIETKELQVYDLVVAKGGVKMKQAPPDPPQSDTPDAAKLEARSASSARQNGSSVLNWGTWSGTGLPMKQIADQLSYIVHHKVNDKTGLDGIYDVELKWTPEEVAQKQDNGSTETAPSIFTAVQEQLGLKLVSTKGPVDTLVIDHIELPSEN